MPILVSVVLPMVSGFPQDVVVNDFAFDTTPTDVATLASIDGALDAFYNATSSGETIARFLNHSMDRATNKCERRYYNLAGALNGAPHGSPFQTTHWSLGPMNDGVSSTHMPEEDACVLTIHGDLVGLSEKAGGGGPGVPITRPKARHRGRLYIGPFNTLAIGTTEGGRTTVTAALRSVITDRANALMGMGDGWSVWSRTNGVLYPVVGGWVDDAWDTQRRRGQDARVKTFFGDNAGA